MRRFAPVAIGIIFALPTLLAFYPPMTDLPSHEASVAILRHWGDADWFPPGLYTLNLGHTNQLMHLLGWVFSFFTGTRWAMKLVVALAQVAIFDAGGRFAKHLGKTSWATLLLAPLALGFTYYWGFVANLLGIACFLYALPAFDRLAATPSRRRALQASGLVLLTYFAHGSAFVVLLPIAFGLAVLRPLVWRERLSAFAPLGVGVLVGALGRLRAQANVGAENVFPTHFFSLKKKLVTDLPTAMFGLDSSELLVAAAIGLLALLAWRLHTGGSPRERGLRPWLVEHRFLLAALLVFGAYLAAPYSLDGAMFVHTRFLAFAWALLVLAIAPAERPSKAWVRIASVAVLTALPIGTLAEAKAAFTFADVAGRDLEALLLRVPERSAVTYAALDKHAGNDVFEVAFAVARVVALRGGRAVPSFTTSPISPVQLNRAYLWDDYGKRLSIVGSAAMVPSMDLDYFGYVVVRAIHPVTRNVVIQAFLPDATLAAEVNGWLLFRSTHILKGLETAMPPIARPTDPTLLERAIEIEDAARQRSAH